MVALHIEQVIKPGLLQLIPVKMMKTENEIKKERERKRERAKERVEGR